MKKLSTLIFAILALSLVSTAAHADGDQWYTCIATFKTKAPNSRYMTRKISVCADGYYSAPGKIIEYGWSKKWEVEGFPHCQPTHRACVQ